MLSQTEEHLRAFVDKITSSLTENTNVRIVASDAWAATPHTDPPTLMYRVADVAVIGERILAVTGHEVGHLKYTGEYEYKFDVSKKPKAAHQLLNVVEDARIERVFAKQFPGARSLFEDLHADGPDGSESAFPDSLRAKFGDLPVKWRYLFNIDRLLHGNALLGSDEDKKAVTDVAACLHAAAGTASTQECADQLEPAYRKLLELFIIGAQELKKRKQEKQALDDALDQATKDAIERLQRPDMVSAQMGDDEDEQDEDVAQALREHEAAESDDGKPGGKDGSPGMRDGGEGEGEDGASGENADPNAPGTPDLDAQSDPSGSGLSDSGTAGNQNVGGIASAGDPDVDAYGEREELSDAERVKPINIFEEMLAEEQDSGNTAIRALQKHQIERNRAATDVERKMEAEKVSISRELSDVFGGESINAGLRGVLEKNAEKYGQTKKQMDKEIRALRSHARSVLQDNSRQRYGGSYESGRHIKKTRLYRPIADDFRIFEKRENVGGKSYSIAVVVDQSGSMGSYSDYGNSKQALAYRAALVFLEAFDGVARTCLIGFTDFPRQTTARRTSRYRRVGVGGSFPTRVYKSCDQRLEQRKFTVPLLADSHGSTPMGAGLRAGIESLKHEQTEVKAIVLVTDGYPSDGAVARRVAEQANRAGIEIYSLLVTDYLGREKNAEQFLSSISRRTKSIAGAAEIPDAVYTLLRGIVKRGGYARVQRS
jgi:hypothetical protein